MREQLKNTEEKKINKDLSRLVELCHEGSRCWKAGTGQLLRDLGKLVSEGWEAKRRFSSSVSLPKIDATYDEAMRLGAYGGSVRCGRRRFSVVHGARQLQAKMIETFGQKASLKICLEDQGAGIISR